MLDTLRSPDEAYWIRNAMEWAMDQDTELDILIVRIHLVSLIKPNARVLFGPCDRYAAYVPFNELASSRDKLSTIIAKWAPLRQQTKWLSNSSSQTKLEEPKL